MCVCVCVCVLVLRLRGCTRDSCRSLRSGEYARDLCRSLCGRGPLVWSRSPLHHERLCVSLPGPVVAKWLHFFLAAPASNFATQSYYYLAIRCFSQTLSDKRTDATGDTLLNHLDVFGYATCVCACVCVCVCVMCRRSCTVSRSVSTRRCQGPALVSIPWPSWMLASKSFWQLLNPGTQTTCKPPSSLMCGLASLAWKDTLTHASRMRVDVRVCVDVCWVLMCLRVRVCVCACARDCSTPHRMNTSCHHTL